MLFQFFIACVAVPLLYSTVPAYAANGPATAATVGQFPQAMIVEWSNGNKVYFSAAVLSNHFAITSHYLSPDVISQTKAFSGNLVNFGSAIEHKVTKIIQVNGSFTIIKLCPYLAPGYTAVSLAEADNFDYQTNTTGHIVYFDATSQALFYHTADVLTDAECASDNQDGEGQTAVTYTPPVMTCIKYYYSSTGTCNHMIGFNNSVEVVKTRPILLIGAKTAAVLLNVLCVDDGNDLSRMDSNMIFNKLKNMRTEILNSSVVDFP